MHHLRFVAAVVLVVAGPGEMTRTCLVRQQLSTCSKRDILLQTEKRTSDWRSVCFLSFPQIRVHSVPQNWPTYLLYSEHQDLQEAADSQTF